MVFTAGAPSQYFLFASRVNACALKVPSVYGPVPTGSRTTSVVGSMSFHRCSGTIQVLPSRFGPSTNDGLSNETTTVSSPSAFAVPS